MYDVLHIEKTAWGGEIYFIFRQRDVFIIRNVPSCLQIRFLRIRVQFKVSKYYNGTVSRIIISIQNILCWNHFFLSDTIWEASICSCKDKKEDRRLRHVLTQDHRAESPSTDYLNGALHKRRLFAVRADKEKFFNFGGEASIDEWRKNFFKRGADGGALPPTHWHSFRKDCFCRLVNAQKQSTHAQPGPQRSPFSSVTVSKRGYFNTRRHGWEINEDMYIAGD